MIFKIARLVAVALVVAASAGGHALATERILNFLSDVTVERDGDLAVIETIRVQAEQQAIKHGILRDFPTTYTRPDGSRVVVGFRVQSVTFDGGPVRWATEPMANGVRVRIGSADTTVATGTHEFIIRYRTTRQIGFFADHDELYWNATGTGWTFGIDVAEARITLPDTVPFRQAAFYTGPQGAKGQDATIVRRQPGQIVFRTTRALPPRNGLTVAAAWQKGVVTPPSEADKAGWWLTDNLPAAVAGLGLIGIVAFYAFAWRRVGRDPPTGTVIPLFAPPEGMSAAAVRFVERMGYDARCFTAAIIDLGVNGHLRMTGSGSATVLWRQDSDKPVGPAESAAKGKLFGANPSLALTNSNYQALGNAKSALGSGLRKSYDGKLFTDNYGWSGTGFALTIACLVAVVILNGTTYDGDHAVLLDLAMLVPLVPIVAGGLLIRSGYRRGSVAMIAAGTVLIAVAAVAGLGAIAANAHGPLDFVLPVAAYILGPLAVLGFKWLQAPTVAGRAVMDRIEGFRLYLGTAEEDRLNALNPPDKTPELFERFLPYAIALDVENRWATRFAGVLAAAGTAAVASSWYQNDQWTHDPVGFTQKLGGTLTQTIASASSAPGSSDSGGGSSGGGSSGGGGGGGGGSGW
ncbi:MAG TPA: DUF2207 domain-containing protein [Xanthobacteraceae bacterium]|jgi:uncharacterized membrane protein YgcG